MKHPWVFWFTVRVRRDWFSYWWKSRGSNAISFQVWIFHISIGLPWNKVVKDYHLRQHGNLDLLTKTNEDNLKGPWTKSMKIFG
jgi:hypothetical protein